MDIQNDAAPELPVETENIRRNSNPILDKIVLHSSEVSVENATPKTSIVISKTSQDLHSEIKNESSIKRVDSDSKFGVMETIPLEISSQEASATNPESNIDLDKPEHSALQNKSLSLNDDNKQCESQNASSSEMSHSATGSETNSLSKYFSLNPSEISHVEGIEFFDALSTGSQDADSNSMNLTKESKDNSSASARVEFLVKKSSLIEEPIESAKEVTEEKQNKPVALLKFFAEDKSGTDRDGKAFFDKIAEDKSPSDVAVFEIKEPILSSTTSQNQFLSSSILSGEIEEAWIPSEKTRQILVSVVTSNSFTVDKSQLTMPGVIIDEEMEDPVITLLIECNSSQVQQRKVLTADDVPADESGLQRLIEADYYHAAINLTKRLLKPCGQGSGDDGKPTKHTPLTLRLWYTRLALLVKLKKYSFAEVESAAFGDLDRPDLYYEFYPDVYKGKRGTMVPFSFRLLLAELPQYQGNHQISLNNLYHILHVIQMILKNVQNGCAEDGSMIELSESRKKTSLDIWGKREKRVLYSLLNCVLSQKDYILAVSITNILIEKSEESAPELYSALGRIYLQLGDVNSAQECFTKAAAFAEGNASFQAEEMINKALLAIAHNNSEEAYKYYQQAHSLRPDNAMLANNMAVCLLYMGRLRESLNLLEKTIHENPTSCLHDGILFNICTLYELESSRCTQKKLAMLELVSKYVGDAFNISCLKIQPVPKG